ncbi:MAG: hypothetical protein ABIO49_05740 [Dokdonella sp.]
MKFYKRVAVAMLMSMLVVGTASASRNGWGDGTLPDALTQLLLWMGLG